MRPEWSPQGMAMIFRDSMVIRVSEINYTILYRNLGLLGVSDVSVKDPSWQTGTLLHKHSLLEFQIIVSGSGSLHVENGEVFPLAKGDCLLVGKEVGHVLRSKADGSMMRFEIQINYEHPHPGHPFPHFLDMARVHIWHQCDTLVSLANTISAESSMPLPGKRERFHSQLTLLLTELMRLAGVFEPETPPKNTDSLEEVDIMAIDNILAKNHLFTAEELASLLYMSKRQLYRIIKKYSGESFKQKLVSSRMETAKELLSTTKLPIEEIAARVGYDNSSSFFKVFRQKTGMTPGTYRRLH